MRIDTNHPQGHLVTVYLDKQPVKNAVADDDEEGWVDVILHDANGTFFSTVADDHVKITVFRLYGNIRLEFRDDPRTDPHAYTDNKA